MELLQTIALLCQLNSGVTAGQLSEKQTDCQSRYLTCVMLDRNFNETFTSDATARILAHCVIRRGK